MPEQPSWRVHRADGDSDDYIAEQAWATNAGALNVGTSKPDTKDESWDLAAIYAPGTWRMVTRIIADTEKES